MGNSLLDFVMALIRDPDFAARYAADPAGVLADARLTGVTIADVTNLIPVVTDSLATATPGFGPTVDPANVWTSGSAAAAFDAFDILPPVADAPAPPAITPPPSEPGVGQSTIGDPAVEAAPPATVDDVPGHQPSDPVTPWLDDAGWHHPVDPQTDHHPGDPSGFDLP